MDHLAAQGVTAIPMHDALIVPVSAAEEAKRELEDAFTKQLKVKPRVAAEVLQQAQHQERSSKG